MMSSGHGQIVNGGLIDFQDNFHRGMAEYANSLANHQQTLAAASGFPMQMQQYTHQQTPAQYQPFAPQGLSTPMQPPPCISGPPAYIHMHGQTYVPVDAQATSNAPKAGAEPVQSAAPPSQPAPLDDEEMERKVRERVEAYYANQKKSVYAHNEQASRRALKGRGASDEDRAADRVHSVNAGMRGRYNSPF